MKLDKFIDNLLSAGFVQNTNDAPSNWFENYTNGMSIFVGIMAHEVDYLGHIPIEVVYSHEDDEEETEKEYMTTDGAWRAINKLINSL